MSALSKADVMLDGFPVRTIKVQEGRWVARTDLAKAAAGLGVLVQVSPASVARFLGVSQDEIFALPPAFDINFGSWLPKNILLIHESAWRAFLRIFHLNDAKIEQWVVELTSAIDGGGQPAVTGEDALLELIQKQTRVSREQEIRLSDAERIIVNQERSLREAFRRIETLETHIASSTGAIDGKQIDATAFRKHLNQGYAMLKSMERRGES